MLPTNVGKGTDHRESRPVWNNVQRINRQNKISPTAVFTRSGRIPVSAAMPKAAASTSAAKPVNTTGPKQSVSFSRTTSTFHKSHSPIRRSFYRETTHSKRNSIERVNTAGLKAVSAVKGNGVTVVNTLVGYVWRPRVNAIDQLSKDNRWICTRVNYGHPQQALKNKGIVDSGCSRHMTWNKAYLNDYQEIHDGGFVAFGLSRGKITGKGTIRTEKLDFDDVYFVNELKFNLFSVLQMHDKKNSVCLLKLNALFCLLILSSLMKVKYCLEFPSKAICTVLTYRMLFLLGIELVYLQRHLLMILVYGTGGLVMRLGHVNFKTMNKLVKGNLVRGLPSNIFNNDHSCVACQKGKQHKATCLAGCFSWLLRMKLVRDFDKFYRLKGIKRKYSTARTPQQNRVTERKNMTLIEAARTMLADSLLPITFYAKAVNTACYVLNRALVTKTQNKTPYELLNGRTHRLDFMRPFGCPVTILNTLDPLEKFEGKADEGFLVGYSVTSKAFRVFNSKTRKAKENLHVRFLKNKPNVVGIGPNWLFDIDSLTYSMNYIPVSAGNQTDKNTGPQDTNGNAGTQDNVDTGKEVSNKYYIVFPLWSSIFFTYKSSDDKPADDKPKDHTGSKTVEEPVNKDDQAYRDELDKLMSQEKEAIDAVDALRKDAYDDDLDRFDSPVQSVGAEAEFNNMQSSSIVSSIPTHKMEPKKVSQALDDESWVEAMQEELLQFSLQKSKEGIFISQDKYVDEILKKFDFSSVKTASTPIETQKPLVKDDVAAYVDVCLYRSMIGSLMYLIASRPDIMFAVCACSRFQATSKLTHLQAVKRIFRRLTSWQCKKHIIVATSTTEAEYVAAAHYYRQAKLYAAGQKVSTAEPNVNSSAGETHQLSSGNISSLAVAKYTSSGNYFALPMGTSSGSGNFLLAVGTSSGSGKMH
nr:hypothetical protein [Tanacetum cinerariifolium]